MLATRKLMPIFSQSIRSQGQKIPNPEFWPMLVDSEQKLELRVTSFVFAINCPAQYIYIYIYPYHDWYRLWPHLRRNPTGSR